MNGGEKAKAVDEDHDADHDHISTSGWRLRLGFNNGPDRGGGATCRVLDTLMKRTASPRGTFYRRTAVWGGDGESRVQRQVEQRGQQGGLDRFTHMCATVTLPRSAASPLPS